MALIEQISELLSQPPGSVIYHLLTLFALQVVLALTYGRWRRDPNDEAARRMMLAAAGTLAARLVLLLVGVYVSLDPTRPSLFLPPLEQALDLATVALLAWGLIVLEPERPRLSDAVVLVTLVVTAVMYLFLLQDWRTRANAGVAFSDTTQSIIWNVLQVAILTAGLVLSLVNPRYRVTLRPFIFGIPLVAHIIQQWFIPDGASLGLESSAVVRLGYLVAFPLWAVLAYRENVGNLMTASEARLTSSTQLSRALKMGSSVIGSRIPQLRLENGLEMITSLMPTQFAAIGLIDESDPQRVVFNHFRPAAPRETSLGWQMTLSDRSALRLAYEQQRGIELLPRGVGARQVHEISQQFNTGPLGPVFIEPLVVNSRTIGFAILAAPPTTSAWTDQERALAPAVAGFLAQAIANSHQLEDEIAARIESSAEPLDDREAQAELERLRTELAAARMQLQSVTMPVGAPVPTPTAAPAVVDATLVAPIIEEAIGLVLPVMRQKRLQLDMMVPKDLPPVPIREDVVRQLVLSLLDNACRASAENGAMALRADLSVRSNGAAANGPVLHISVADSGPGIPAGDVERVFDSLQYLPGSRPISGLGGNGANMAVLRQLAQASGGTVSLGSVEGPGATFALSLPTTTPAALGAAATKPLAKPATVAPATMTD